MCSSGNTPNHLPLVAHVSSPEDIACLQMRLIDSVAKAHNCPNVTLQKGKAKCFLICNSRGMTMLLSKCDEGGAIWILRPWDMGRAISSRKWLRQQESP